MAVILAENQPVWIACARLSAHQIKVTPFHIRAAAAYSYQIVASDPEHHAISYSLESGPAGMVISVVTGELTWSPTLSDVGEHPVNVIATDTRLICSIPTRQLRRTFQTNVGLFRQKLI